MTVTGRKSPYSLYDKLVASFEDDGGLYNQADAGKTNRRIVRGIVRGEYSRAFLLPGLTP